MLTSPSRSDVQRPNISPFGQCAVIPPTWKKWLIPVRAFAREGTQMEHFIKVSHSVYSISSKQRPSGQSSETSPIHIPVPKRTCVNQSGCSEVHGLRKYFSILILKLTISTCSGRWLIWPPHWGITKPDKPLHDPEDISRAGGNRNIGILFAFQPFFGSTDKSLSIYYDKFITFQQLGFCSYPRFAWTVRCDLNISLCCWPRYEQICFCPQRHII